tara:strand:+ start:41 stop:184 length:144 start_codon:yes stop_codon:yes gene_type:complete
MSNPRDASVIWYCRKTRGWKPAADRYGISVEQVKTIMRDNARKESGR